MAPGNVFRNGFNKIRNAFADTFGLGPGAAISAVIFSAVVLVFAVFWFFYSAPPKTIIITGGGEDSRFQKTAERYAKILARDGVKLKILRSEGSLENLNRLLNPSFRVDIGFVQSGMAKDKKTDKLVSLGSIAYQPLYIFYNSPKPIDFLSQFNGKRLAIGANGTGAHVLALELLAMNGIKPGGGTELLEMDDDASQKALLEGKIDAAFMMGDAAASDITRELLRKEGIRLFDFSQADGYTRRVGYLNKIVLLKGSLDFGKNIPEQDVHLLSPTVELIAREDLHPALSDLLIAAASQVHGRPGIYQKRNEFPTALDNEYAISNDARRYYKSGKSFLYRYLPFWLAGFVNRIVVVFIPMVLILIPGLRSIPYLYRWRMRLRILKWYRALLALEAELGGNPDNVNRLELLKKLDSIEESVSKLKMPASFADQFYSLLVHIGFVRERLTKSGAAAGSKFRFE